jgi:hypothetical protein
MRRRSGIVPNATHRLLLDSGSPFESLSLVSVSHFRGALHPVSPANNRIKNRRRACRTTIDRRRGQAEMHGSGRGAIDKYNPETMKVSCGRQGHAAFAELKEPRPHRARPTSAILVDLRCSTERPARSPGRKSGLPDLRMTRTGGGQARDRAQFVSFNFLKSTDLHGRVKRSFATPHRPARPIAHPSPL